MIAQNANTGQVASLSWAARVLFGCIAIAGTAVYAASFGVFDRSEKLLPLARSIGIASGISWIAFGAVLLAATRCRPSILAWADACLVAQAAGIGVLMASVLVNLAARASDAAPTENVFRMIHGAIILAADVLMAWLFVRRARRLGMSLKMALALWVLALNGFFLLLLIAARF
ncbi:MAG: hypothetical protein AB1631_03810 [Acidobacteriota bacterium]